MKKIFLFLSLTLVSLMASARQISVTEARAIAAHKIAAIKKAAVRVKAKGISENSNAPVYMFNAPQGGFAIISGDDRMPNMILAYSETATLNLDNCSPSMRAWLDELTAFIAAGDFSNVTRAELDYSNPVAPLVTTKWNQNAPYNLLTPAGQTVEHCPTGCSATAMAQIVNYWKYATKSYDWANMLDEYDETATEEQNLAVAQLMLDCGKAVNMRYSDKSSGAYGADVARGLVDEFGYNPGLRIRYRTYIPTDEWFAIVKRELDAARPVAYYGATLNAEGHAFVCDGYDTDGLFHINWGWGGLCDGFYELNILKPVLQGIGGAMSGMGFSDQQHIITDLRPADVGDTPAWGWELQLIDFDVQRENEDATIFNISWEIGNFGYRLFQGVIGLYIWPDDQPEDVEEMTIGMIVGDDCLLFNNSIVLGINGLNASELPDGIYRMKLVAIDINSEEEVEIPCPPIVARLFRFEIKDGKLVGYFTTGIENVENVENIEDVEIYNLSGQKVGTEFKGIIIQRGKKVLKK